ncbi:MAG: hypothetical protein ACKPBB_11600, partial [Sphaerospermopsis kisseleviana]
MARVYCENEGAKLFWQISYLKSLSNVSIPLRGKGYEKHQSNWMIAAGWGLAFPSPCGEKVMKNVEQYIFTRTDRKGNKVSIPLRGKGYEKRQKHLRSPEGYLLFPSPCGEKVMKNTGE